MEVLLHPGYFPNITTMSVVTQHKVIWEAWDNFQKQTYRNRCYIATDQGALMLTVPIQHAGGATGRQAFRDVRVENTYPWQRNHWRSLATAYRSAPFFEYFETDLRPLFEKPFAFLMDLNLETVAALCRLLGIPFPTTRSDAYEQQPRHVADGRGLILAKGGRLPLLPEYPQVFQERHGFLQHLSTLDLLFNEGPSAKAYLDRLVLPWDG
jgi:hypothetical protein